MKWAKGKMQDWSLDDHEYLYTLPAKTKSLFKPKHNEIHNHSLSFLTCLFSTLCNQMCWKSLENLSQSVSPIKIQKNLKS